MFFPTSGVEVSPFIPVFVGFVIAICTTPAGVSGAFLLMPFQLSVLGFTTPGVTPTNLLFNVISTPGGIFRFFKQGDVDFQLVLWVVRGAVPGVVTGAVLRVSVFAGPVIFKAFVGLVLLGLGSNLVVQSKKRAFRGANSSTTWSPFLISMLGAGAGIIGGIYGISGGSIIAPVLVSLVGFPVRRVAPAALVATLMTSVAGVVSFAAIDALSAGPAQSPDWALAALFGVGGVVGGNTGARFTRVFSETWLRSLLGVIAVILGATYVNSII